MKTSLKTEKEPKKELAVQDSVQLATVPVGLEEAGEILASDLNTPRLQLINKMSTLSDTFAPGSWVFDKEIVLADGKTPFEATVLAIRKSYIELLEYGTEQQPKRANKLSEVAALGQIAYGKTQADAIRKENQIPFTEMADCLVLIPAPEKISEVNALRFSEEYNGKRYGLAMWTLRGSAYKSAKQIFTSMRSVLRNGLEAGKWECASRYVSKDTKQSWYEPNMRLLGLHDAKFTEWAKKIKEGIATTPSAE